ncbi:hypothetical protein F383_33110 [Gossypium arboreum]|uniref:Uncharacterized protein n=1 Tax=Gossypium arboreum TaxID=29729 RepID=A0A0B0N143_GOSAR|nr:hypothetical protein F383_33110 [Gossypium arboreum]
MLVMLLDNRTLTYFCV